MKSMTITSSKHQKIGRKNTISISGGDIKTNSNLDYRSSRNSTVVMSVTVVSKITVGSTM